MWVPATLSLVREGNSEVGIPEDLESSELGVRLVSWTRRGRVAIQKEHILNAPEIGQTCGRGSGLVRLASLVFLSSDPSVVRGTVVLSYR